MCCSHAVRKSDTRWSLTVFARETPTLLAPDAGRAKPLLGRDSAAVCPMCGCGSWWLSNRAYDAGVRLVRGASSYRARFAAWMFVGLGVVGPPTRLLDPCRSLSPA